MLIIPSISFCQLRSSNKSDVVKIQGECIVRAIPENIVFYLEISERDDNYSKCLSKALQSRNKLREKLLKNGIEDSTIKTIDISVKEVYHSQENPKPKFQAIMSMQIENKYTLKLSDDVVKSILNETFELEFSISFKLSEIQKEKMRTNAIELALKDAFSKAEILSKNSNVKLGNINTITYGDDWFTYSFHEGIDNDIIKEVRYSGLMPIMAPSNPYENVQFNPKEIAILKKVFVEWNINK